MIITVKKCFAKQNKHPSWKKEFQTRNIGEKLLAYWNCKLKFRIKDWKKSQVEDAESGADIKIRERY